MLQCERGVRVRLEDGSIARLLNNISYPSCKLVVLLNKLVALVVARRMTIVRLASKRDGA